MLSLRCVCKGGAGGSGGDHGSGRGGDHGGDRLRGCGDIAVGNSVDRMMFVRW